MIKSWPVIAPKASVITIGNFDGMHIGHQALLQQLVTVAESKQLSAVLLTFEPYPYHFFYPDKSIARLTTLREKIHFVQRYYPTIKVVALSFTAELAQYSAAAFIDHILITKLNTQVVIVGQDFHFGYQRQGDVHLLKATPYFKTQSMAPVNAQQQRVSSTWVRQALANADLLLAKQLLDRDYTITGRVIYGRQLARQWGYPTANISLNRRLPAIKGVFLVKVNNHYGVANIGQRPTIDTQGAFLEVHIFNFEQTIYGEWVTITFLQKIRDEQKFASLQELRQQIQQDVITARALLNKIAE